MVAEGADQNLIRLQPPELRFSPPLISFMATAAVISDRCNMERHLRCPFSTELVLIGRHLSVSR